MKTVQIYLGLIYKDLDLSLTVIYGSRVAEGLWLYCPEIVL